MMNFTPSKSSTQKHFGPSERTLDFLRQYAYAWNAMKVAGQYQN